MAEVLNVKVRKEIGKRPVRKLRREGSVPAVLYGHGEATLSLSIPQVEVSSALRHGSRLVELQGELAEKAFIRDLQWDTFGLEVMHMDLARISEHERVKVQVVIELRGEAPGVKEGGVVQHLMHELSIECAVSAIPDKIQVSINSLAKGSEVKVSDLSLPEGVKVLTPPDEFVVQCVEPVEAPEEAAVSLEGAEPEVIGRKAEAEGEEEEE
jgi:large subunit ribosomal protein L25